jgi:5'-nucleotidase (lipoprotein e(P4) family)
MFLRNVLWMGLCVTVLAACDSPPAREDWKHSTISQNYNVKANTLWVAESRAWHHLSKQRFAEAARYVERTSTHTKHFAVVLDIDQTVLNNISYHVVQDRKGAAFTPNTWRDWVEERAAVAVPGALPFIARVNALGGHVALVTNRRSYEAHATIDNLAKIGLVKGRDYELLDTYAWPDGAKEKDARFRQVDAELSKRFGVPVTTIAYLGDQSTDAPTYKNSALFFCIPQGNLYGKPCEFVGMK